MATRSNTRINFNRAKPLTLNGVPHYTALDSYQPNDNPGGPEIAYPFNDSDPNQYYYYLIDNIPFLRQNERDSLFSKMTQNGFVGGFPFKGNAAVNLLEYDAVIIDFQNGYIHQDFSERVLQTYERLGVVVNNVGSSVPYYVEDGIQIYFTMVSVDNAFLNYNDIIHEPNTNSAKDSLSPELDKIYVSVTGEYVTSEVITDKISIISGNPSSENVIPFGVIKAVDTANKRILIDFNAEAQFGFSAGTTQLTHIKLDDVNNAKVNKGDQTNPSQWVELWVYGHYGYSTRIKKYVQSGTQILIGNPVCLSASGTLVSYDGSGSFIGFVYAFDASNNTYYIVTDGEYGPNLSTSPMGPTLSLTPGVPYYLTSSGVLTTDISSDSLTVNGKVGISLNQTTLLLENNSANFAANLINLQGGTGSSNSNYGNQIGATVQASGIPAHAKFITNKGQIGKDPMLGKLATPTTTSPVEITSCKNYMPFHYSYSRGTSSTSSVTDPNRSWGITYYNYPSFDSGEGSGNLPDSSLGVVDNGMTKGFHFPKTGVLIQRLSPEFQNGHVYDRVLFFVGANNTLLNKINAVTTSATGPTQPVGFDLPMTSALDLTSANNISPHTITSIKSTVSSTSVLTTGLIQNSLATVELKVGPMNQFRNVIPALVPTATGTPTEATKSYLPNTNTDTSNTNPGISLKSNNGVLGLYKSGQVPGSNYCYLYYKSYEVISNDANGTTYHFHNCYVTTQESSLRTIPSSITDLQYDRAISFPAGALGITVGGNTNTRLAGLYNPNPHQMNYLNKHKNSWFGFFAEGNVPANDTNNYPYPYLLGCLGNPTMNNTDITNNVDQSLYQIPPYGQFEFLGILKSPPNGPMKAGSTGPSVNPNTPNVNPNSYSYLNYHTFYGNPWLENVNNLKSTVTTDVGAMFRYNSFERSGIMTAPWIGKYRDSFFFCSPTSMVLGPAIRTGYVDWHGYKVYGAGAIIYIYRGAINDAIANQDYLDISLDETALPYQTFGDWGQQVSPNTDTSPDSRWNFDFIFIINGSQRAVGANDTVRVWLPPISVNDLRTYEGSNKPIGLRNKPELELTYTGVSGTGTGTGGTGGGGGGGTSGTGTTCANMVANSRTIPTGYSPILAFNDASSGYVNVCIYASIAPSKIYYGSDTPILDPNTNAYAMITIFKKPTETYNSTTWPYSTDSICIIIPVQLVNVLTTVKSLPGEIATLSYNVDAFRGSNWSGNVSYIPAGTSISTNRTAAGTNEYLISRGASCGGSSTAQLIIAGNIFNQSTSAAIVYISGGFQGGSTTVAVPAGGTRPWVLRTLTAGTYTITANASTGQTVTPSSQSVTIPGSVSSPVVNFTLS